jgi:hypothetical protein
MTIRNCSSVVFCHLCQPFSSYKGIAVYVLNKNEIIKACGGVEVLRPTAGLDISEKTKISFILPGIEPRFLCRQFRKCCSS